MHHFQKGNNLKFAAVIIPVSLLLTTCILDPIEQRDETGVCYQSLDQYEALIANKKPRMAIVSGIPDTIFMNSISREWPLSYSYETDSNADPGVSYSLEPRGDYNGYYKDSSGIYQGYPYANTRADFWGSYQMTATADTINTALVLSIDTMMIVSPPFTPISDTFLLNIRFNLVRRVHGNYCNGLLIDSTSIVVIRSFPNGY